MVIKSTQNALIKYALTIKDKKGVVKYGECLVETEKLVKDLLASNHNVSTILCAEKFADKFKDITSNFKGKTYYISAEICRLLTDSVTPSGIFAFVKVPQPKAVTQSNFLVLENLQDPTNLGALIRSAVAFGFKNIYTIGGVFPYSYKVIRSSMGYIFDVNIIPTTLQELNKLNLPIYVGDMSGEDVGNVAPSSKPFGVAIGNEGQGVTKELKALATQLVKIPMQNGVESLNASVSGGILMYNLSKK